MAVKNAQRIAVEVTDGMLHIALYPLRIFAPPCGQAHAAAPFARLCVISGRG